MGITEFYIHALALTFITSGQCIGLHIATRKGMILQCVNAWFFDWYDKEIEYLAKVMAREMQNKDKDNSLLDAYKKRMESANKRKEKYEFILKPIINCPPCMASVHGTIVVATSLCFWPLSVGLAIWAWVITVTTACAVNKYVNNQLNK